MNEKNFFNQEVNEGGAEVAQKGEDILNKIKGGVFSTYEKIRWPAKKLVMASLTASLIAPAFGADAKGPADDDKKKGVDIAIGRDYSGKGIILDEKGNRKIELSEQDIKDKDVYDKFIALTNADKSEYVRTKEDKEAFFRAVFLEYRGAFKEYGYFKREFTLKYPNKLTEQQMIDLYSIVETGRSTGVQKDKNGNVIKDVVIIQTIYADLSSENMEILKSNSNILYGRGIDGMMGTKTIEVINKLKISLQEIFDKQKGLSLNFIEKDKVAIPFGTREIPEEPDFRHKTTGLSFEAGVPFDQEQTQKFEEFLPKLNIDSTTFKSIGDIKKYIEGFENIKELTITGGKYGEEEKTYGFNEINNLGEGTFRIEGGDFVSTFTYEEDPATKEKQITQFKISNKDGSIGASCDNISQTNTKEAGYAFEMKNLGIDVFGSKLTIETVGKYDLPDSVGGGARDIRFSTGGENGLKVYIKNLNAIYQKQDGEPDFERLVKDIWSGKDGIKVGDLVDNLHLRGGDWEVSLGGARAEGHDGDVYFNGSKISINKDGNFNIENISGDKVEYKGGSNFYAIVNGENTTLANILNDIAYNDAKGIMGEKDTKFGLSVLGGALSLDLGINSNFSQEGLDACGGKIEAVSKEIDGLIREFNESNKNASPEEMIKNAISLKGNIFRKFTDISNYIMKEGGVALEDGNLILDIKKLSDNFEIDGREQSKNDFGNVDVLLEALANDLGKNGAIEINLQDLEKWEGFNQNDTDTEEIKASKKENKDNFISQKLFGKNLDEALDNFKKNLVDAIGENALKVPGRNMLDIAYSYRSGQITEVKVLGDQLSAHLNLTELISKKFGNGLNVIVTANANLGLAKQESFVKFLEGQKDGKAHLGANVNIKEQGGAGLLCLGVINGGEDDKKRTFDILAGARFDAIKGDFNIGVQKGDLVYKGVSLSNVLLMSEGTASYGAEVDRIEDGKFIPSLHAGVGMKQEFLGNKGGLTTVDARALASFIPIEDAAKLRFRCQLAAERMINEKLSFGAKINWEKNGNNPFYVPAKASVYFKANLYNSNKHHKNPTYNSGYSKGGK
jgi:hypothetical protein